MHCAYIITAVLCLSFSTSWAEYNFTKEALKTTADRLRDHGYPAEEHFAETADNYVLHLFRIPYSHKLKNQDVEKPAVFLQHGMLSCSDAWLLPGPNDGLAFLLADAGYDVWMGNARGNRYSRNNTRLSPDSSKFWKFSWHEIGNTDVARMIDFVLSKNTAFKAVHYVGHSQGTNVFFALMSLRTEYNAKIKTAHLMAPVAWQSNQKSSLSARLGPIIGKPGPASWAVSNCEIMQHPAVGIQEGKNEKTVRNIFCSQLEEILSGRRSLRNVGNTNLTIIERYNETHPAGACSSQIIHTMQEYMSGHYRQFDHGWLMNLKVYGRTTPPDYPVQKITARTYLYYAEKDDLADPKDVRHLASQLPNLEELYLVPDPTFSHGDFAMSYQVKEVINDRIIAACNRFEQQQKVFI